MKATHQVWGISNYRDFSASITQNIGINTILCTRCSVKHLNSDHCNMNFTNCSGIFTCYIVKDMSVCYMEGKVLDSNIYLYHVKKSLKWTFKLVHDSFLRFIILPRMFPVFEVCITTRLIGHLSTFKFPQKKV